MRGNINIEEFMAEGLAEWHSFYQGRTTRRDTELAELKQLQTKADTKQVPYNGWQLWKRWFDRMRINRRANRLSRRIERLTFSTKNIDETLKSRAVRTRQRLFSTVMRASDVSVLVENREHERNIEQPEQLRRLCSDLGEETRVVRRAALNLEKALKPPQDQPPQDTDSGVPAAPPQELPEDELRRLAISLRNLSSTYISGAVQYPASKPLSKLTGEMAALQLHDLTLTAESCAPEEAGEFLPKVVETLDKLDSLTSQISAIVDAEQDKAVDGHMLWKEEVLRRHAGEEPQKAQLDSLISTARR